MMEEQQLQHSAAEPTLEEVLAASGVPDPEEQCLFIDLGREIHVLQQRFESWRQLWQHNCDETLETVTADTRPRIENMVRLARELHSFRAEGPMPGIVSRALNEANQVLAKFTIASLPARVLH